MIFNLSALILFFFKILKNPGGGTRYPTNQISLALLKVKLNCYDIK